MPRITFAVEETINDCDPELVSKLRCATSYDELASLEDEYGYNEVLDAIFAIAVEEGNNHYDLSADQITEWLWDEYYDHYHEDTLAAFLVRNRNTNR